MNVSGKCSTYVCEWFRRKEIKHFKQSWLQSFMKDNLGFLPHLYIISIVEIPGKIN